MAGNLKLFREKFETASYDFRKFSKRGYNVIMYFNMFNLPSNLNLFLSNIPEAFLKIFIYSQD